MLGKLLNETKVTRVYLKFEHGTYILEDGNWYQLDYGDEVPIYHLPTIRELNQAYTVYKDV